MEQNQMNNDEIEIDLREIFSVLLSHLGIIILSGLVLGLVAIVGTKVFITPQYQSVTKMYVLAKQNNDTLTSADMQTSTLLTKDYAEMIQSRTVTEAVIAQLGLDMTHEQLVNKISVSNTTDTVSSPSVYWIRILIWQETLPMRCVIQPQNISKCYEFRSS